MFARPKYSRFLGSDDVWNQLIPPKSRHAELRCFGFRLLSSAEGHLEDSLIKEGKRFLAHGFMAIILFATSHVFAQQQLAVPLDTHV